MPTFLTRRGDKILTIVLLTIIIVSVMVLCIRLGMVISNPASFGIIALHNYEHAVVICGEEFTVNKGHIKDKQIKELRDLAEQMCPNRDKDVPKPTER